jgi:hypothetical protein
VDPAYITFRAVVDFFFTGAGAFEATDALEAGCADPRGAAALGAAARGADPAEDGLVAPLGADDLAGEDGLTPTPTRSLADWAMRAVACDRARDAELTADLAAAREAPITSLRVSPARTLVTDRLPFCPVRTYPPSVYAPPTPRARSVLAIPISPLPWPMASDMVSPGRTRTRPPGTLTYPSVVNAPPLSRNRVGFFGSLTYPGGVPPGGVPPGVVGVPPVLPPPPPPERPLERTRTPPPPPIEPLICLRPRPASLNPLGAILVSSIAREAGEILLLRFTCT